MFCALASYARSAATVSYDCARDFCAPLQDLGSCVITHIRTQGWKATATQLGQTLYNHPVDTGLATGALILQTADLGDTAQIIHGLSRQVVSLYRGATGALALSSRIHISPVTRVVIYTSLAFTVIAPAVATDISLAQLKDQYSFGPDVSCPAELGKTANAILDCLDENKGNLDACQSLIPKNYGAEQHLFTRHPSPVDTVSMVHLKDSERFCFYTVLKGNSHSVESCVDQSVSPPSISINTIPVDQARFHQDLQTGMSAIHIRIKQADQACGIFHGTKAHFLTRKDPEAICAIISGKGSEEAQQLCWNPQRPATTLTLRPVASSLCQQSSQEPNVELILNPHQRGLEVEPLQLPIQGPELPSHLGFWKALSCWWHGDEVCHQEMLDHPHHLTFTDVMTCWWKGQRRCVHQESQLPDHEDL